MSALQKFAWFNLVVIIAALAASLLLAPFLGKGALGCFGLLGLIGLSPFFFKSKKGEILADERDQLIQQRSWVVAYSLFWVAFVLAAVLLSAVVYGQEGAVPVYIVQGSVFVGFMLVYGIASIATLIQYRGASLNAE